METMLFPFIRLSDVRLHRFGEMGTNNFYLASQSLFSISHYNHFITFLRSISEEDGVKRKVKTVRFICYFII